MLFRIPRLQRAVNAFDSHRRSAYTVNMNRDVLDKKLQEFLFTEEIRPNLAKDVLHNGIQTWGRKEVRTVGFTVSANIAAFELAKKKRCDMIIVHHGIGVQEKHLDRITYERFAYLIKNDISLWSAHYSLDAHPIVGNNAQILDFIGARITEPYADFSGVAWGYIGEMEKPATIQEIVRQTKSKFSPNTVVYPFGKKLIRRVACVSGKGAPYPSDMEDLMQRGVDLYITGEASEWNRDAFRESKMHFIAGGHYHTEMFGVRALADFMRRSWGLNTVWLDVKNPV